MIRNFFYVCGLAALVLSVSLPSCTEDQLTSSPILVDTLQTASVQGIVYADLNLQLTGKEFAPVGTKLLVTIPYSQLSGSRSNAGNWAKMITVGANGTYSVDVPANHDGVSITITPNDFVSDLILEQNSQPATKKAVYTGTPISVSVKVGLDYFRDITYSYSIK